MIVLEKAHNQWQNRPKDQCAETLEELHDMVSNRRAHSRQREQSTTNLRVIESPDGDGLSLNGQHNAAEMTHWSFGQLCSRLSVPSRYMRTLPAERVTDALNYHLATNEDQRLKVLTYEDQHGLKTQAVTSTSYGRVWDADLTAALLRVKDASDGRWYNPKAYDRHGESTEPKPSGLYASDRDVFAFLIDGGSYLDAGPRAEINRGFFAWNSEVGNTTLGLMTFLFNGVCGNHYVWGASEVKEFKVRHTVNAPHRFADEITPALHDYTNQSMKPVEVVITRAMEYRLPKKDDHWWKSLVGSKRFTKGEIDSAISYAREEEGQCETLWDLTQGLTASAREYAHIDARVALEKRAGKLLDIVKDSSTAILA